MALFMSTILHLNSLITLWKILQMQYISDIIKVIVIAWKLF